MGGAEAGGHNMINKYDHKRAVLHFRGFFTKLEFSPAFLYIILISAKGTAKLRWAGWGEENILFLRVPHSSSRVRRSSEGYSIL